MVRRGATVVGWQGLASASGCRCGCVADNHVQLQHTASGDAAVRFARKCPTPALPEQSALNLLYLVRSPLVLEPRRVVDGLVAVGHHADVGAAVGLAACDA